MRLVLLGFLRMNNHNDEQRNDDQREEVQRWCLQRILLVAGPIKPEKAIEKEIQRNWTLIEAVKNFRHFGNQYLRNLQLFRFLKIR